MLPRIATGVLVLLFAAVAGCGEGGEPEPTPDPANLTVEEVYARFAEAINRPGSIYEVTIEMDQGGGNFTVQGTRKVWVDVGRDLVRGESEVETRAEGQEAVRDKSNYIIANGVGYTHAEQREDGGETGTKAEARPCPGVSVAASAVLGCAAWREESTTEVEGGQYEGHPAIIIVTSGISHGEAGTSTYTERLFLDAGTFLPLALEDQGTFDDSNKVTPFQMRWKFKSRFVSAQSLPDDFFDPASIGYVEHDVEEPLQSHLDITVYWLGRRFVPGGSLAALALKEVRVADPGPGPGYTLTIDYRLADDEFASAAVTIQEWDVDMWNAAHTGFVQPSPDEPPVWVGNWWERPCWEQKEVELAAGHAMIILGFENDTEEKQPTVAAGERACPSSPHDHFLAIAYLGSTVFQIAAPATVSYQQGRRESPYDTLEGMEAVVKGLQPRE
jgi:hypothetical protein